MLSNWIEQPHASDSVLHYLSMMNDNPTQTHTPNPRWARWMFLFLTTLLALSYLVVTMTAMVSTLYNEYILSTMDASHWRTTNRLQQESTYYPRHCDERDISTTSLHELTVDERTPWTTIMTHGVGLMKHVLSEDTATDLRDYILFRNEELSTTENLPVDAPDHRWSFGIGANEHPSVTRALLELSHHEHLSQTLQKLLGTNPAMLELTSITVDYGAMPQGYHPDVKPLGSAVQYARTFTHTYSIFIALQDVTPEMGATEVCPGTHFCANDFDTTIGAICARHGFQVSSKENVWKTGDAMVLNQCTWHRGQAHDDPEALERVVLILTFANRPQGKDVRQLSHGTYFHIRPDMYGFTWEDLKSVETMVWPYTMLRSLGVWKQANAQWGWDLISVMCLRISNEENGYTFGELVRFVQSDWMEHVPSWLQGEVMEEYGWRGYISACVENVRGWCVWIYTVALMVTLGLALLSVICQTSSMSSLVRMGVVCGIAHWCIWYAGFSLLQSVKITPWANNIRSNRLFARPFPIYEEEYLFRNPTTLPETVDVLVGTRFDSKVLGMYNQFLDYHPGNVQWRKLIDGSVGTYDVIPPLRLEIVHHMWELVDETGGRFLLQDEDWGGWRIMDKDDACWHIERTILYLGNGLIQVLDQELRGLVAEARFGMRVRESGRIKEETFRLLWEWRDKLDDTLWKLESVSAANTVGAKRQQLRSSNYSTRSGQYSSVVPRVAFSIDR